MIINEIAMRSSRTRWYISCITIKIVVAWSISRRKPALLCTMAIVKLVLHLEAMLFIYL